MIQKCHVTHIIEIIHIFDYQGALEGPTLSEIKKAFKNANDNGISSDTIMAALALASQDWDNEVYIEEVFEEISKIKDPAELERLVLKGENFYNKLLEEDHVRYPIELLYSLIEGYGTIPVLKKAFERAYDYGISPTVVMATLGLVSMDENTGKIRESLEKVKGLVDPAELEKLAHEGRKLYNRLIEKMLCGLHDR